VSPNAIFRWTAVSVWSDWSVRMTFAKMHSFQPVMKTKTDVATSPEQVDEALRAADGSTSVAIVSLLAGIDADAARARFDETGHDLRRTVER